MDDDPPPDSRRQKSDKSASLRERLRIESDSFEFGTLIDGVSLPDIVADPAPDAPRSPVNASEPPEILGALPDDEAIPIAPFVRRPPPGIGQEQPPEEHRRPGAGFRTVLVLVVVVLLILALIAVWIQRNEAGRHDAGNRSDRTSHRARPQRDNPISVLAQRRPLQDTGGQEYATRLSASDLRLTIRLEATPRQRGRRS